MSLSKHSTTMLTTLSGWGRYPRHQSNMTIPTSFDTCQSQVITQAMPLIAQGMGRSYGDSALADYVMNTRQLDCFRHFDAHSGQLRCDAGVNLATLLSVFVPKGWFLPVTPGTKFISVGGAIASDVHGKNHHQHGCFSEYVSSLELLLGDGRRISCSRTEHPELFHATCGGMGLTGLILTVTLQLHAIQSAYIHQTTYKAANLAEALALFAEHHRATYSVAWIDCLASGASLGRSLLMLGEHATGGELHAGRTGKLSIPVDMPHQLLNHYSIRAFNAIYYRRIRQQQSTQHSHYEPFFYPLDGIHHWNRLYGKQGFVQYQCVIPQAAGTEGLRTILQRIARSGRGSFLAVLKAFGKANANLLSFPTEGYTLALDFKVAPGVLELLNELDALLLDFGGRLYLAKDARMSEATFKRSYPQWEKFQAVREQYGAIGHFASLQSQRLGLD